VKIKLTFGQTPQEVPGKARWTSINVVDTFLEFELGATVEYPDGVTLLVDGQVNKFYFRKGWTEGDTLAASATADNLYIVEWRDLGPNRFGQNFASQPRSIQNTWGSIKAIF
jgi:hypothetical protein